MNKYSQMEIRAESRRKKEEKKKKCGQQVHTGGKQKIEGT